MLDTKWWQAWANKAVKVVVSRFTDIATLENSSVFGWKLTTTAASVSEKNFFGKCILTVCSNTGNTYQACVTTYLWPKMKCLFLCKHREILLIALLLIIQPIVYQSFSVFFSKHPAVNLFLGKPLCEQKVMSCAVLHQVQQFVSTQATHRWTYKWV